MAAIVGGSGLVAGNVVEPLAADLKRCPAGHATLKDIPILYGYPDFHGKQGKRLQEAVDKGELILGGCMVDYAKFEVRCATCRFVHVISGPKRDDRSWWRTSTDPGSFHLPLDQLTRRFPLPPARALSTPVEYTQGLDGRGRRIYERLSFESSRPFAGLKADIEQWAENEGIEGSISTLERMRDRELSWVSPDRRIEIGLAKRQGPNVQYVWYSRRFEHR